MRKSLIYERIIIELERVDKLYTLFQRSDLVELINEHKKYSSFLYKHSDERNRGKMKIYFQRNNKKRFIRFKIDKEEYRRYFMF